MVSAEIIAIGTELLLGEILDTNTKFLARQLKTIGVNVYRAATVGDNAIRIADAIRESLNRADIVITSGGLGPTVDDPTRSAVALAFQVENEFQQDLWEQIEARFLKRGLHPTENNRRQAFLPVGACGIPNPVGTAPAFYMEHNGKMLVSLPGVPAELEYLYENVVRNLLKTHFQLDEIIKSRVIHTSGIGESVIDSLIGDLEHAANPTIGLTAHPGNVDIRITARAINEEEVNRMIAAVEQSLRSILGDSIYGCDETTLLQVIELELIKKEVQLELGLAGLDQKLIAKDLPLNSSPIKIVTSIAAMMNGRDIYEGDSRSGCTAILKHQVDFYVLDLRYNVRGKTSFEKRRYNGALEQVDTWAWNNVLDFIWRQLTH